MKRALPFLLLACGPSPGAIPAVEVDVEAFAAEVQGYVAPRCATLDCHGDEGRPLRLYGEVGLRQFADGVVDRDAPLTTAELEENALSAANVDPGAPTVDAHLLLLKPLAESAGGAQHEGEEIWADRDDPGYLCLRAWLAGEVATASDSCAAARALVALPPDE